MIPMNVEKRLLEQQINAVKKIIQTIELLKSPRIFRRFLKSEEYFTKKKNGTVLTTELELTNIRLYLRDLFVFIQQYVSEAYVNLCKMYFWIFLVLHTFLNAGGHIFLYLPFKTS